MKLRAMAGAMAALLLVPEPASAEDTVTSARDDASLIASGVLDRLNAAWNAADGAAFAAQFTADADVINIFGEPYRGAELAARMQFIFDGIFKGSRHVGRELEIARYLAPDTILVVSSARIAVPAGPMSPEARNRQTLILMRQGEEWRIRHWHNTPVVRPG